MQDKSFHIAVAQIHSGGGIDATLARLERQCRAAAAVGADAILFSECVLQGYGHQGDLTCGIVAAQAIRVDSAPCRRLSDLARELRLVILAGFFEVEGCACHNACLVAWPNGCCEVERKYALTEAERAAGIVPGRKQRTPFVIRGVRCAVIICSDGGIEDLYPTLRREGFDYRLCPTAGGGALADMLHEKDLDRPRGRAQYRRQRAQVCDRVAIRDLAASCGLGFASANALGPFGRRTCHVGHCMIVDNRGVLRAQVPGTPVLEHQQDAMVHAEVSVG